MKNLEQFIAEKIWEFEEYRKESDPTIGISDEQAQLVKFFLIQSQLELITEVKNLVEIKCELLASRPEGKLTIGKRPNRLENIAYNQGVNDAKKYIIDLFCPNGLDLFRLGGLEKT